MIISRAERMRILVTCFEPFDDSSVNTSQECCRLLPDHIGHIEVTKLTLPVSFARAPQCAADVISEIRPDAVLSLGQAPRDQVCLERVALNLILTSKPDNDGNCPNCQRLIADSFDGVFTIVDVDLLQKRLASCGHTVRVSNSAGLYVCNALYFKLLAQFPNLPILFVHIPKTINFAAQENQIASITPQRVTQVISDILKIMCHTRRAY